MSINSLGLFIGVFRWFIKGMYEKMKVLGVSLHLMLLLSHHFDFFSQLICYLSLAEDHKERDEGRSGEGAQD